MRSAHSISNHGLGSLPVLPWPRVLTFHSSRSRFAARLNSGVRAHGQTALLTQFLSVPTLVGDRPLRCGVEFANCFRGFAFDPKSLATYPCHISPMRLVLLHLLGACMAWRLYLAICAMGCRLHCYLVYSRCFGVLCLGHVVTCS
jgi:hypothetical protein